MQTPAQYVAESCFFFSIAFGSRDLIEAYFAIVRVEKTKVAGALAAYRDQLAEAAE
jgi:hypothetical protein